MPRLPATKSSTEFSTLVLEAAPGQYQSGGVETHVRHLVSKQGSFEYTSSSTDLAVKGNGFFIVKGADGQNFLTRAGSFVKDANGDLVNAAGYKLLGVKAGAPDAPANGAAGLEVVNVGSQKLKAVPSTSGSLPSIWILAPASCRRRPRAQMPRHRSTHRKIRSSPTATKASR